jgi:antitoxin (DNA-binding transcriptional repressor) of toxin-antitoxin stability system
VAIDDAHAGETIMLAKAGKPRALLEPLEADDLAAWEEGALLSGPAQQ